MELSLKIPGKLILLGEWAVLQKDTPCLVCPISKYVNISLSESSEPVFYSMGTLYKFVQTAAGLDLIPQNNKMRFVKQAVNLVFTYLEQLNIAVKPFTMMIDSTEMQHVDENKNTQKIGYGSSSAVTVGVIKALFCWHGLDVESEDAKLFIYKLSSLVNYEVAGKVGSAFDIAVATFGKTLRYTRFYENWLDEQAPSRTSDYIKLAQSDWPGVSINQIDWPDNLYYLVGYTKKAVSTPQLIKAQQPFIEKEKEQHERIMKEIGELVDEAIVALKRKDAQSLIKLMRQNIRKLRDFDQASQAGLETPLLRQFADIAEKHNGAGKFSGAGGGDCAVAVFSSLEDYNNALNEMKQTDILLFPGVEPIG